MEKFPKPPSQKPAEKESSGIVSKFRAAHQESQAYLQNGVRVNDSLWYHIAKEKYYEGQIGIHLYKTEVGKGVAGAKAFIKTYAEGLEELARRLESDPALANITAITGWSKLVYENPKLLQLLGFDVTERDENTKEALASMSREKFLTRPWVKTKS